MKRFSKFALALIASVSFVCFLFYKFKYDKLYRVLQVLELFGDEKNKQNLHFLNHPPSFQRISDQVFAYSAHCSKLPESSDICPTVSILALSQTNDFSQKMTCQLWYDSSIQPITVPLSAAKVNSDFYILTCESKFAAVMPFGVSLGLQQGFQAYLHIEAPIIQTMIPSTPQIAVCLLPQPNQVDSTLALLENVLVHHYFEINQFYIYDNGVTGKFIEAMSGNDYPKLNIDILPWNIPFKISEDLTKSLVETDCHFRSRSRGFNTNFVLGLNQILAAKSSIREALEKSGKSGQLLVDVHKFCSEYPEEKSNIKVIKVLSQNFYNSKDFQTNIKASFKSGSQQINIDSKILAVHDYGECHNYDMDVKEAVKDLTFSKQAKKISNFLGRFFPDKKLT